MLLDFHCCAWIYLGNSQVSIYRTDELGLDLAQGRTLQQNLVAIAAQRIILTKIHKFYDAEMDITDRILEHYHAFQFLAHLSRRLTR